MPDKNNPIDHLVLELHERAKELNCLYKIEDSLNRSDITMKEAFRTIIDALPNGFQFPNVCKARLVYGEIVYQTDNFKETPWVIRSDISVQDKIVGNIAVYYLQEMPQSHYGPFSKTEKKLLDTIADRLGHFILHQKLKIVFQELNNVREQMEGSQKGEWRFVLNMVRKTDPNLFMSLLRKMLHLLCWKGVEEAEMLMRQNALSRQGNLDDQNYDDNKPLKVKKIANYDHYVETILNLAKENLDDDIILSKIQKWIQEDKSSSLIKVVDNSDTSLTEIADAIRKFYHLAAEKFELEPSTDKGLRVSLLRRFFTDQLEYISVAKEYVKLTDFRFLIDKMIFPSGSHGKLGGKSAGIFLASHILNKESDNIEILRDIKTPKTWYITSDGVISFIQYNNLEEVLEQKYKELEEVRIEYPHLVQLFKNSEFPPDIVKGLSIALDDLGEKPIIVRSSSLLEDQIGAVFSGKYKSLFLANQGSKQQRLYALMDAIAEVYASTFSPDPIEYRAEKGLLDFHEEMGIMIQEVVGTKIGKYYCPIFAGVAFSNNEFRWSPRIKRDDGLVRIVPGLGTRAVDRLSDDYPILVAPGQPNLRVNVTADEIRRYSPQRMDVINLETNEFESIPISKLIEECGTSFPKFNEVFSIIENNMIRQPGMLDIDDPSKEFVVTFEGLISKTDFLKKIHAITKILQEKIKSPVDIEFAHDGNDYYLLQCRPQSNLADISPDNIPKDIPQEMILFNAKKFISNGKVPDITHVVYVDPLKYSEIPDIETMLDVGKAISKLNKILPKRKFILIGPGRWGSRGDIKLGVSVTYSDINNTAMLIEVARKKGNYVPDLSFGTHFFQDLVEANIRYLPLYPDDEGIIFNENFFNDSENIFDKLIPEFEELKDIIKVIEIPYVKDGMVLKVFVNAEIETALAIFTYPTNESLREMDIKDSNNDYHIHDHWRWRMKMAEKIANEIDPKRFGIKAIYLVGSTNNATATAKSDIDLIVHYDKNECNLEQVKLWFEGWSLALSEMNYLRTGIRTNGLLDVHFVTDNEIEEKSGYVEKLNSITQKAKVLMVKDN
ncbi:PEP/pyruvate-binding domain-containing protein [Stygiobacter electus]|uniref:Phosphoenolpyruvate synthase n=1 Tax=Stygiobacter electus TaxID=3032292 RepID=A0AAE3NV83_9BACT|nr:PEP/pyruvate-binding domain-containing protein [Stygiobacter electus]MDF1610686.1 PEP/pyruvate-binding domain-containing protein [Stygiobacter electus]